MKKLYFAFASIFLLFSGCSVEKNNSMNSGNFFQTDKDVQSFRDLSSDYRITLKELKEWDKMISQLIKDHPSQRDGDGWRLFAYLYSAQKAFADASYEISEAYSGSIDLISLRIVQLFYPNYAPSQIKKDAFSEKLTNAIMPYFESRFHQEEKNIKLIKIKDKEGYWSEENGVGRDSPSMQPWALHTANEFQSKPPPPPNDPRWKDQLQAVEKKAREATELQKERGFFWDSRFYSSPPDWKVFAQKYMDENSIPLEMQLKVRKKLAIALIDALIAVFHDKYLYLVRRPFMLDSDFQPLFKTPNHPSYPAAHATISYAVLTVLCYYFAEDEKKWHQLANEACESRLWAGIHFPLDIEAGQIQGRQVGNAVLFRSSN